MKKSLLVCVLFLSLIMVSAAANDSNSTAGNRTLPSSGALPQTPGATQGVDKAYQCLENQIKNKTSFSLQEAVFGILALGSKQSLLDTIQNNAGSNCWPKSGCTLKETSQVALAYERIGKNTQDIENWLLTRNGTPSDLTWYLEADISNHGAASCTISYGNTKATIQVNDDMTLSGNPGSCLSISPSGYWLKVQQNCLNTQFEVSCTEDFVTTLLYQKSGGGTVYVAPTTNSAPRLGTTRESVGAQCFKTGSSCDYEGSLWAALALQKTGNDPAPFIPYLTALASDNTRYFPSSFIFSITGGDDYYSDIIQSQKSGKYWEMSATPYNTFYDTSLALLALQGRNALEADNARSYLLSIQTPQGCWNNNNIRDTGFILYSGWGRSSVPHDGGSAPSTSCTSAGYSCEGRLSCLEAQGSVYESFQCADARVCCSVHPQQQTCTQRGGLICSSGQTCSGTTQQAIDGSCCIGSCQVLPVQTNECEQAQGSCSASCGSDQDELNALCADTSQVCCIAKETPASSGSKLWIWILGILIVLVALGILFRNKIRIMLFKARGKGSSSPYTRPLPPSSPGSIGGFRPRPSGFAPVRSPAPVQPRRAPPRDREMEETLKKLKEMSE
ncbi:hypothetical protein KW805_03200 [Candidatus Pacearchaeota archaeon]|nr:hypothetical protein [Candidatus Pacearchaeota archaeon]